jgi:alkanesulfonate monooxygenase SsuD/methylene tetrahydromethanopterin reductase-like flavin-dependent oxidoreductase (luciferase family)
VTVRLRGVGLSLPVQDELAPADIVDLAVDAERMGFGLVVCGEIAGPEVFALLGAVAARTSTISIGTAIISFYTRSAALAAMGFSTLDHLAPGRVFAGVGSGSSIIVEGWHGRRFDAPLRTARSFIADLRAALHGERIGAADPSLGAPPFRLTPTGAHPMPVVLAAMHPGMLRLAGAVADGVLLAFCPVGEVAARAAVVRQGAVDAGRDPAEVAVMTSLNAYAGPEEDRAMLRFRRFVLQYAVLPTHRASIERSFPAIDDATEAGRPHRRTRACR